jgi:hypothetical protein
VLEPPPVALVVPPSEAPPTPVLAELVPPVALPPVAAVDVLDLPPVAAPPVADVDVPDLPPVAAFVPPCDPPLVPPTPVLPPVAAVLLLVVLPFWVLPPVDPLLVPVVELEVEPPTLSCPPTPLGPLEPVEFEPHARSADDAMIAPNGNKFCILIETSDWVLQCTSDPAPATGQRALFKQEPQRLVAATTKKS